MKSFEDIHRGGVTARVVSDYKERVAAALFDEIELEPVARGGRGVLYRFELADGYGLIRRYRRGGVIRHALRERYLFTNRALRELETLRELRDRELPVPVPLGAAWQRTGWFYSGRIATQELEGENLLSFLRTDPPEREAKLRQCGETIRTLHDAGVFHADLQVENLFVGRDGITILDFDKARVLKALSPWQRTRNLLRLARSMRKRGLPGGDFECVCEGYGSGPHGQRILDALDGIARMRGRRRWVHGAEPTESLHVHTIGKHWTCESHSAGDPEALLRLIDEPGDLLKRPATWTTRRVGDYVVKEFRLRSVADFFRQFRDRDRFRRAWRVANALQARGVAVPEACAWVEERRWGVVRRSATVARYLHDSINVEEAARELDATGDSDAIAAFLERLAEAVNNLERAGAWHADLSGKNILTTRAADALFYFIDLDSVHLDLPHTESRRLKNHIQLYDSFCDLWGDEVLTPFIARMLAPGQDAGPWLERVQQGQRKRRARQEKRWRKQRRT